MRKRRRVVQMADEKQQVEWHAMFFVLPQHTDGCKHGRLAETLLRERIQELRQASRRHAGAVCRIAIFCHKKPSLDISWYTLIITIVGYYAV